MRLFDERYSAEGVAVQLKREAFRGIYSGGTGKHSMAYLDRCTCFHAPSWTHVVFNREEGNHDFLRYRSFSRCFTLILTFVDPPTRNKAPFDPVRAHPWVMALFGQHADAAWIEKGAVGTPARALHLWADEQWRPIYVPTREQEEALLERGWAPYEYPAKNTCIAAESVPSSS